MSAETRVKSYALKRANDDEKFGFAVKPTVEQDSMKYLRISNITPGSPAERAGLQIGMIIIDINNVPLVSGTIDDAKRAIGLTENGMPLMMGIKMEGASAGGLPRRTVLPAVPLMAVPPGAVAAAPKPVPTPRQHAPSTPTTPTAPLPRPPSASISNSSSRASVISSASIDIGDAIILDSGAWQCKIGFASQASPIIFPTIVGRHRLAGGIMGAPGMAATPYFGSAAFAKKGILKLSYPYDHGVVRNWDDMSSLWKYAFRDELRTEPKDRAVLITEPMFTSKEQREKMAEMMFETFEVSALHIALSSLLGMYAVGRTNDTIAVDIGDTLTQILPVRHDYNAAFLAGQKYSLAGCDVTERLAQLLSSETGHTFTSTDALAREIKERLGAVAVSCEASENAVGKEKFTLPDGNVIEVGSERFKCTEILFDPARIGMTNFKGVHEAVINAALKCEGEAPTLLQNIVLCGGSTMFPGFAQRLENEVRALTQAAFGRVLDVKVATEQHGKMSAWLGGVAVSKLPGFQNQWISRKEYFEGGSAAIHRKSAPL